MKPVILLDESNNNGLKHVEKELNTNIFNLKGSFHFAVVSQLAIEKIEVFHIKSQECIYEFLVFISDFVAPK